MNLEQYAASLLRLMFKSKCKSIKSYPCYQDEETKIAFADYTVNYPDQPPNSWFIVFSYREIFLVTQDMIVVPKVYTTLPVCILHVVNNDTMEQVPKVFQKVVPYLYTKNKKGYTFVAEAFTGDSFVPASKWKLRIIGSYNPLPCLSRDFPSNTFAMKEIRDYYIPNDKKILFRYSVKGALPHPVTVQVRTSKPDAFIKLQILENEESIVSAIGKGQAIIPAFNFLGNEKDLSSQSHAEKHEESITLGSPDSHTISEGQKSSGTSKTRKGKEKSSEKEKTAKEKQAPRFEPQLSAAHSQQDDPNKPYWVLRLVTEHNEADLLEVKKDTERADEIRAMKQAWEMTEPGRAIKASQARLHYLSRFFKKTTDTEGGPVGEGQVKPAEEALHWAIHGVIVKELDTKSAVSSDGKEAAPAGSMLWKKWQMSKSVKDLPKAVSSESGTTAFLATKEERERSPRKENIIAGPRSRSPTILEMSPQLIQKELECMDLSQYVRKTKADALLQTEELSQQQAMQKAEEVHQFRQYRARVLSIRDIDQEERFRLKDEVLDMYGEMRNSLDEARQKIFNIREEYRNKLLEAERLRLEALAAEEAAVKMESEKKTPVPDTQKKKKGKKK
uniref:Androglobin n=1 Tax=Loxodonta africana TaxID=9785 RepID=G3U8C8_LOXAF